MTRRGSERVVLGAGANANAGGDTGGGVFSLPLHINYEDTDAGGVVYYGNYPGYMERARNACLRQLGFPPGQLKERHSMLFVVTDVRLKYLAPARLDDEIRITVEVCQLRRASMVFTQQVRRDDKILVDAGIKLAVVNSTTCKPCRMPAELADALRCPLPASLSSVPPSSPPMHHGR